MCQDLLNSKKWKDFKLLGSWIFWNKKYKNKVKALVQSIWILVERKQYFCKQMVRNEKWFKSFFSSWFVPTHKNSQTSRNAEHILKILGTNEKVVVYSINPIFTLQVIKNEENTILLKVLVRLLIFLNDWFLLLFFWRPFCQQNIY